MIFRLVQSYKDLSCYGPIIFTLETKLLIYDVINNTLPPQTVHYTRQVEGRSF